MVRNNSALLVGHHDGDVLAGRTNITSCPDGTTGEKEAGSEFPRWNLFDTGKVEPWKKRCSARSEVQLSQVSEVYRPFPCHGRGHGSRNGHGSRTGGRNLGRLSHQTVSLFIGRDVDMPHQLLRVAPAEHTGGSAPIQPTTEGALLTGQADRDGQKCPEPARPPK